MKRLGTLVASVALVVLTASTAVAADTPAMLSSWQPVFSDQSPVGGHQEMTVINHTNESMDGLVVEIGPAPCDCLTVAVSASHGSMIDGNWFLGTLEAGETALLTVDYEAYEVVAAEAFSPTPTASVLDVSAFHRSFGLAAMGSFAIA